jgi:hypothetical protein
MVLDGAASGKGIAGAAPLSLVGVAARVWRAAHGFERRVLRRNAHASACAARFVRNAPAGSANGLNAAGARGGRVRNPGRCGGVAPKTPLAAARVASTMPPKTGAPCHSGAATRRPAGRRGCIRSQRGADRAR